MNKSPKKGKLLLSEPFMMDHNFKRTVILLTEYKRREGSIGFILNRPLDIYLDHIMPEIVIPKIPLFSGGPVEPDTLHYVHSVGNKIPESTEIVKGVFWGGDFKKVIELVNKNELDESNIKFFVGYSGWEATQIEAEIAEKSWMITDSRIDDIFKTNCEQLWKSILNELGGSYKEIANYPENPTWN